MSILVFPTDESLDDKPDRPYTTISFERVDEDTPLAGSSFQPPNAILIKPRRELRWKIAAGSDTDLRKISQEYGSFVRRNARYRQPVRRFHAVTETTQYRDHQCDGYQREELTLAHAILDNTLVVHTIPRIDEICVVCGKIVKRKLVSRNSSSTNKHRVSHHVADKLSHLWQPYLPEGYNLGCRISCHQERA